MSIEFPKGKNATKAQAIVNEMSEDELKLLAWGFLIFCSCDLDQLCSVDIEVGSVGEAFVTGFPAKERLSKELQELIVNNVFKDEVKDQLLDVIRTNFAVQTTGGFNA